MVVTLAKVQTKSSKDSFARYLWKLLITELKLRIQSADSDFREYVADFALMAHVG